MVKRIHRIEGNSLKRVGLPAKQMKYKLPKPYMKGIFLVRVIQV